MVKDMISNEMIIKKLEGSILPSLKDRVKKMILYGSMARGDHSIESDFDCILVVDSVDDLVTDLVDEFAAEMLLNSGVVFSIIPVTEENFNSRKFNPLFINANREGVTLWQKTA